MATQAKSCVTHFLVNQIVGYPRSSVPKRGRMNLTWSDTAGVHPGTLQRWAYFGPWCEQVHKYCPDHVKARVVTVLMLGLTTNDEPPQPKHPSEDGGTHFAGLPKETIVHILRFLPVRGES